MNVNDSAWFSISFAKKKEKYQPLMNLHQNRLNRIVFIMMNNRNDFSCFLFLILFATFPEISIIKSMQENAIYKTKIKKKKKIWNM